jgi:hypothetical protein
MLLDFITPIIFAEDYKLWNYSLCHILLPLSLGRSKQSVQDRGPV